MAQHTRSGVFAARARRMLPIASRTISATKSRSQARPTIAVVNRLRRPATDGRWRAAHPKGSDGASSSQLFVHFFHFEGALTAIYALPRGVHGPDSCAPAIILRQYGYKICLSTVPRPLVGDGGFG